MKYKKKQWVTKENLVKMNVALNHRGPDTSGIYVSDNSCVGLCSTRLAFNELERGNQSEENDNSFCGIVHFLPQNKGIIQREVIKALDRDGVIKCRFWGKKCEVVITPAEQYFNRLGFIRIKGKIRNAVLFALNNAIKIIENKIRIK